MKKLFFTLSMAAISLFSIRAAETPQYPGGEEAMKKFISENLVYPENAKENSVEGVVTVGFIVLSDGKLKDIKSMNMIDPDLEKEAVRIVGIMPTWIPAEKDGTPVEAPSKVEIPFILEE